jgi:light-regulated signal transduction histidine kinase (bacteriophytochrome)
VILQSTPVLLKSLGTAQQQQAAASRIERSAKHISSMVGDLLDVAHSGSMGLGLYIAYTIAKAHRGTLTAESSREHGTLFTACLPRTSNKFQTEKLTRR